MKLLLKAKHFKDTFFAVHCDCAVAKSAMDLFPLAKCFDEDVDELLVDGVKYNHERYSYRIFVEDKTVASTHNYDETVIREIELIKV